MSAKNPAPSMTPEEFWAHASPEPNSGCWLWDGPGPSSAYGYARVAGRMDGAHRHAMRLTLGHELPSTVGKRARYVLHRCSTKGCIRPDHLYLGTKRQNTLDSWKGIELLRRRARAEARR